ncbi:peptidylprolyl isomerase [Flavimarina sp. Hel_I_48]|uniref:peptidylprolyl isomerase n=1 Tax=Flavimarina sp. Hel_I_48 TaxID=1392488 RepID=UPI0004DECD1E|nr:peptidylprolyl isomerase [Flavimarina sp. Hel_I_48]
MAVLNKIRQRSVFLIIIIALALFSFVLADLFKGGGFNTQKSQRVLATVNGEDIDRDDFAKKVELQTSRYGGQMSTTRVQNMVWQQELNDVLLGEQMDELGITVEEDRLNSILKEALQNEPQFQDANGVFSEGKMREYIATLRSTNEAAYSQWVDYEQGLAKNEEELIYFNLIKAGMGATLSEGKQAYEMQNSTRDAQFVNIPFSSIPDDQVKVSKSDIESYIKKHQNKYQVEANRSLRFVKFDEKPTLKDEKEVEKEVATYLNDKAGYNAATKSNDTIAGLSKTDNPEEFVNEFSDQRYTDRFYFKNELPTAFQDQLFALNENEVYGPYKDNGAYKISRVIAVEQIPDSVKSSHILLPFAGLQNAGAVTRSKAETKKLADSLAEVLRKTPSKMAELATEFSTDQGSAEKGGDLGYVAKNTFVKPFNDFVFMQNTGDIDVVESQFGYHVIKIEDQKGEQRAIKLATVSKEIEPSQQTVNDIFTATTKFEMAANADQKKFTEVAKKDNYTVRPVNNIKALDETIPGEGSQREIIRWAFEEETEVGDIKRFSLNGGYLVVQLTKKSPAGLMQVDEASASVTPLVRNEKKAKMIQDKISGNDLTAIASANNVQVQTASAVSLKNPTLAGAGREPKVVGALFGLKENTVSEPIVGEKGVYLVKPTAINKAKEMDNYLSFTMQQTATNRNSVNANVTKALEDAAEIEDQRANFY